MGLLLKKHNVASTETSRGTSESNTAPEHARRPPSPCGGTHETWLGVRYGRAGDPSSGHSSGPETVSSPYCRHCQAPFPLSATHTLSTHSTSEGVVTYFRCPIGHAGFFVVDSRHGPGRTGMFSTPETGPLP